MEAEGSATRLDAEWDQLAAGDELVILDEVQEAPEIFRRLRGTIDAERGRKGRYLLLGSVSPALMRNAGESLAGRIGMVEMGPLHLAELGSGKLDRLWLCGGYPDGGILEEGMFPDWQTNYIQALVSRDFPNWGLPAKPRQTERLLRMLAAYQGQAFNASQLGRALGVDYKTVMAYCDFLEEAYLIRRLPAWYANVKKRLVKAPRLYLRDTGLLHALLRIGELDTLYAQPWVGHSWEGFLVEQTLSGLKMAGRSFDPYAFRTSDGYELDLLLDLGRERWALEAKLTSNPSPFDVERLNKVADMAGAERRILLCRITKPIESGNLLITHAADWVGRLAEL